MGPSEKTTLKVVGRSGQISLGKKYAGKIWRLETLEDGDILLRSVAIVPESQLWTLQEPDRGRIERGLAWAARQGPRATSVDTLSARAAGRGKSGRASGRRRGQPK